MAITPEQASKLNEMDRESVRKLEEDIDKEILDNFPGYERKVTYVTGCISVKVREEIERIYNGAGWRVTYQSDQRDGDYLEFRPPGEQNAR